MTKKLSSHQHSKTRVTYPLNHQNLCFLNSLNFTRDTKLRLSQNIMSTFFFLKPFFTTFFFFSLLLLLPSSSEGLHRRKEAIVARHGAVAADDRRCSRIGRNVLIRGGNAVDAAVAAALCLGVVSPASSGIGGGAFMLVRTKNGKVQAFDMRETAPSLASKDMYGGNTTLKASGSLSIAVPGELAGLHLAWKQHGLLPWRRLVRPAYRLARHGFKISPYLYMQMEKTSEGIFRDRGLREILTKNGNLLQPGETCYNKKLANTLKVIGDHGPDQFYNGSIGRRLVRDVRRLGGIIKMKDLQMYRVRVREATSVNVLGLDILGMPPPSSGGAAMALILNMLSQYRIPSGVSGPLGAHRTIEALKYAFSVRMNLGDPDFTNVTSVFSDMLSLDFAKDLKKTLSDDATFGPVHYGGRWNQIFDHGTSHLSIVDRDLNAVSMTSTVNSYFGSQLLSRSTGIFLNNEMDDFSIPRNSTPADVAPPAPANFIQPGKRPLSSMSPTIILKDGHLKAVIGASGGAMIIASTTEVLMNHFARGMNPFSSVMEPRFYHQLIPNVVSYENWTTVSHDHFELPERTRDALRKKGHVLKSLAGGTICQFIVRGRGKSGALVAVSDPRKGGFPSGY